MERQSKIPPIALDEQVTNDVDARPAVSEGVCAAQAFSSGQLVMACMLLEESLVMFDSTPPADDQRRKVFATCYWGFGSVFGAWLRCEACNV